VLRTSNNIALEGTRKSLRDGEDAVSTILIWTKHRFQAGIILGLMILMLEGALAFLALTAVAIITLGFLIRVAVGSLRALLQFGHPISPTAAHTAAKPPP